MSKSSASSTTPDLKQIMMDDNSMVHLRELHGQAYAFYLRWKAKGNTPKITERWRKEYVKDSYEWFYR